jgi:hypothetical protein
MIGPADKPGDDKRDARCVNLTGRAGFWLSKTKRPRNAACRPLHFAAPCSPGEYER